MKAEHRHELKTNALADMMGRVLHILRTGPSRHGLLIAIVVALTAAVALGGYYWWTKRKEDRSALWVTVDSDQRKLLAASDEVEIKTVLDDLKKTADQHPGTPQAHVLRLNRARVLIRQGTERLYSADRGKAAREDIEEARKIFREIADNSDIRSDNPLLTQEAMMSTARASESLGDFEEALKGYRKLAQAYPNSVLGEAAKKCADYLGDEDHLKQVKELYEKLDKEYARSQPTSSLDSPDKKP